MENGLQLGTVRIPTGSTNRMMKQCPTNPCSMGGLYNEPSCSGQLDSPSRPSSWASQTFRLTEPTLSVGG